MKFKYANVDKPLAISLWDEVGYVEHVTEHLRGAVIPDTASPSSEPVLTAQEIRAEIARERREAVKARDLDRRIKRQNKRSQCY